MSTAPDDQILSRAKHDHAIVVTLDADFHALLARTRGDSPSVIRLRVEGLGARETASIIQLALDRFREELEAGAVVTVKANKIVCHRLPIGRPK